MAADVSHSEAVVALEPVERKGSKLPPFGREIAEALLQGKRQNVFIYAGHDAWERARLRRAGKGAASTMVSPPGEDPATYRWPRIGGGVLIAAHKRLDAFNVARAVVSCGTPMAFAIFDNGEALIVKTSDWRNPLKGAA